MKFFSLFVQPVWLSLFLKIAYREFFLILWSLWSILNLVLQEMAKEPGEVSVDDPEDILRLAELLEGVSVNCPTVQSQIDSKGDDSKTD